MPRPLRLATFSLLILLTGALAGCTLLDNHRLLTLEIVVNAEYDAPDATTNPIDITEQTCGDTSSAIDCVEAVSTTEADYLRFDNRGSASDYAATLDDGFLVNYIVMDFEGKDDASRTLQTYAMQALAGTWQDYEGDIPER